jgi:hypothetical protein
MPSTEESTVLSKAVKFRRRVNRERRRMPAWRLCMRYYKQQQLTLLKLQRNSNYGSRATPVGMDVDAFRANMLAASKLKFERQDMTRIEWLEEFKAIGNQRWSGTFTPWARILVQVRVDIQQEQKKLKHRRRK